MFWVHYLREPFSTKADDSAVHRYTLFFAHGTNTAGAEGIMNSCYLAPATLADGPGAVGHYSQATNWSDEGSLQQIFDRVVQSGKWQCPVMIHGLVMTPFSPLRLGIRRGAGSAASLQDSCCSSLQAGQEVAATFRPHHCYQLCDCSQEAVSAAQGSSWRPIFQLGPTHAASVKQHLR